MNELDRSYRNKLEWNLQRYAMSEKHRTHVLKIIKEWKAKSP